MTESDGKFKSDLFLNSHTFAFLEAIASLVVTKALTHSLTHSLCRVTILKKNHVNTLNFHFVEKAKDIIRGDSLSTSHIFTHSLTN